MPSRVWRRLSSAHEPVRLSGARRDLIERYMIDAEEAARRDAAEQARLAAEAAAQRAAEEQARIAAEAAEREALASAIDAPATDLPIYAWVQAATSKGTDRNAERPLPHVEATRAQLASNRD